MENTSRCLYFLPSALLFAYGFYLESIRYKEGENQIFVFFALAFKRVYLLFRHGDKPQKLARIFFVFAFRRCRNRELSPF